MQPPAHYIRTGVFSIFDGGDAMLIAVDLIGLHEMEYLFEKMSEGRNGYDMIHLQYLDKRFYTPIRLYCTEGEPGIFKSQAFEGYEWHQSKNTWQAFAQMLNCFEPCGAGHHFLRRNENASDQLQVVFSLNEYDLHFWETQFSKIL